jgi:hypothetical protein
MPMDYEVVHIAVAPPARPDEKLVSSVAAVIDKSLTHTRLLLAGQLPKIIAQADSPSAAEAIIKALRQLGLVALALPDSELRQLPPIFEVQTLELSEKAVTFRDSAGTEKKMAADDVSLILSGRVENSVEVETTKTRSKFSWGRTLMLGGIPAWRKVEETTTEKSSHTEDFVRLYSSKSAEPAVELWQYNLNYSFLGAERGATSAINFSTLVRRLREVFAAAAFDDRLAKPLALATTSSWQDVELNCRLIYLFRATAKA